MRGIFFKKMLVKMEPVERLYVRRIDLALFTLRGTPLLKDHWVLLSDTEFTENII